VLVRQSHRSLIRSLQYFGSRNLTWPPAFCVRFFTLKPTLIVKSVLLIILNVQKSDTSVSELFSFVNWE
jgi:hypothetical protein